MRGLRAIVTCICFLGMTAVTHATPPERNIRQFAHRSWGEKEGYPGLAQALTQTHDGFLWIGTSRGLFRFDGVHFEHYASGLEGKFSEAPVRGMLALPDNSLWVAFGTSESAHGICVLRNANAKCFGDADGVTSNPISVVKDHDGTIWANTEGGVLRFNGTRWNLIGKEWSLPEGIHGATSQAMLVDSKGTLWLGLNRSLFYLKPHTKHFEPTGVSFIFSASIVEASDGTIWLADTASGVRPVGVAGGGTSAQLVSCVAFHFRSCSPKTLKTIQGSGGAWDMIFDHGGSLWVTTFRAGLLRIPHPHALKNKSTPEEDTAPEHFTTNDGLSADNSAAIFEDKEGNIWVGTRDGLDQFRSTALIPVKLPTSMFEIAIAPADGGALWATGGWSYLTKLYGGESSDIDLSRIGPYKPYRDTLGVSWFFGDSLREWEGSRLRIVTSAPDRQSGSFRNWQIVSDHVGTLWAFANGLGFFSLDHKQWKPWPTPAGLAKQHVATMFSDSDGRVWVSTYEGDVVTMNKGIIVEYPIKQKFHLRTVKTFAEHGPQQIWAGGAGGLLLIDKQGSHFIRPADVNSLDDVRGIVDADNEGLWLSAARGIFYVSREDVDHALKDPSYHFGMRLFDSVDGLSGRTDNTFPYPKAIRGTDGRIWFSATQGVSWIDPSRAIPKNMIPPPVVITALSSDDSRYLKLSDLRLSPSTAKVQIEYTALSLSVPERVHFRYKLEGFDKDWQYVNTRRQAYYSNLRPGAYQFRVIASNNDDVWNESGASLRFSIEPAYYQTAWFRLCCAAFLLLLIWCAYVFRVRTLESQFVATLDARIEERTRIARDLHDTLLQSFNALLLVLQTVSNVLPQRPDEAKRRIDSAIDQASDAIAEGRDTLNELRSHADASRDLDEAIGDFARELIGGSDLSPAPEMHVRVEGTSLELNPVVRDEVYRIVSEALRNAIRHANANRIHVEIRYNADRLQVRVSDDGEGIDPAVLKRDHKVGHWGLRGMRERARLVGGTLEVWSQLNSGTEIDLSIPAANAYTRSSPKR